MGAVLFLVVVVCIALIGSSGYVKYQLDSAGSALAAPELQLTSEQQIFDKIRRTLGYSGFIGLAQKFTTTRDPAMLPDMKTQLKLASEALEHIPEKTSAETRHDLQAILDVYKSTLDKAERSTAIVAPPALSVPAFTADDLLPLYAALPVLNDRVTSALAANRQTEQNKLQLWATLLTVMCWSSLIIAATLAASIFLILRGRNSAPMRALAQSVKNMARGDMRSSIWGMERQDAIGELSRAVDQARFHFSQLPDMSLLSEQGPVRIRFEGNTRSLFEAMMRVISRDSELVHEQASSLSNAVNKQQEALAHVIERVEAVLQNVEKRAVSGDQQVRQALQGMLGSAESLKNAQEHAADQLNRIIPFLQERTQGLSEIAQITGKQVAQALQSLAQSERGLRSTAEHSEEAIRKFSTTADTLGERMFGAVNLLQASGKVLAETTEVARSRFDTAIERIGSATFQMPAGPLAGATGAVDHHSAERLETAVGALETAHSKLSQLLSEQADATRAHIDLLTTQSGGLLTQASTTSQTLSTAADRLRDEQAKLAEMLARIPAPTEQHAVQPISFEPLLVELKSGFVALENNLAALREQISASKQAEQNSATSAPAGDLTEQMRDHWYQMAAQIEATRSNLAQVIMEQAARVETHLTALAHAPAEASSDHDLARDTQHQMEQQTLILNELVATLGLLDAHMQELRSQVAESRQRAG